MRQGARSTQLYSMTGTMQVHGAWRMVRDMLHCICLPWWVLRHNLQCVGPHAVLRSDGKMYLSWKSDDNACPGPCQGTTRLWLQVWMCTVCRPLCFDAHDTAVQNYHIEWQEIAIRGTSVSMLGPKRVMVYVCCCIGCLLLGLLQLLFAPAFCYMRQEEQLPHQNTAQISPNCKFCPEH